MKKIAFVVALIARLFLREEWLVLRRRLCDVISLCREDKIIMPSLLAQELLISGEDHRFFDHGGIDLVAICRAAWRGMVLGRVEGASTIEMQIIRVLSGRFERSLRRKLREMMLATLLDREFSKSTLPELYLQIGYFGWRMNNYSAACRHIGHSPDSLNSIETARLVARLKYPQPKGFSERRRDQIDNRARHLLALHVKHRLSRNYRGLLTKPTYETI